MSSSPVISSSLIQIPLPSNPSALTNNLLQGTAVYRSLSSIINVTQAVQSMMNLGTVATTSSDGKPATFTAGGFGNKLIRIAPAGQAASLGVTYEWVAGGGQTIIPHGLGRIPIGYWIVRKSRDCDVYDGDTAWDATNIYFHTTHSDADCIMSVF